MDKFKIALIVGARPQFIKAAPLQSALSKRHPVSIIHTGQHYDYEMSRRFFSEMEIPEPHINLGVGSGAQGRQTGRMLLKLEQALLDQRPGVVLVFGDTNSTLAGALAAAKLHVPVGHVEAGLRSYNRIMAEEINRLLTDHVSDFLFCPTQTAVRNLRFEGIPLGRMAAPGLRPANVAKPVAQNFSPAKIERIASSRFDRANHQQVFLTGDIMYDSLVFFRPRAEKKHKLLKAFGVKPKEYYLLTIHRAENTDQKNNLDDIFKALTSLDKPVLFPAHPRTSKMMGIYKIKPGKNVKIVPPVSYLEMLCLEMNALKILTDSGGVQKEAYLFGVPCVTLRDETEWVETVHDGWNLVVGTEEEAIMKAVRHPPPRRPRREFFGDGRASENIAGIIDAL